MDLENFRRLLERAIDELQAVEYALQLHFENEVEYPFAPIIGHVRIGLEQVYVDAKKELLGDAPGDVQQARARVGVVCDALRYYYIREGHSTDADVVHVLERVHDELHDGYRMARQLHQTDGGCHA